MTISTLAPRLSFLHRGSTFLQLFICTIEKKQHMMISCFHIFLVVGKKKKKLSTRSKMLHDYCIWFALARWWPFSDSYSYEACRVAMWYCKAMWIFKFNIHLRKTFLCCKWLRWPESTDGRSVNSDMKLRIASLIFTICHMPWSQYSYFCFIPVLHQHTLQKSPLSFFFLNHGDNCI